jgi:Flp pilus assembly pilin Flp
MGDDVVKDELRVAIETRGVIAVCVALVVIAVVSTRS